jgi:glutathione peroxidase
MTKATATTRTTTTPQTPTTLANFSCSTLMGETVELKQYLGKVILIVNTASACGFTPQYAGLETLYQRYQAQGLSVLAFPCNQFGAQEPGSSANIASFCDTRFALKFPVMEKVDVNGANAHPLYQWLKNSKAGVLGTRSIKWNFTKFLIAKDGTVFKRYGSIVKPEAIAADIEALLAA